MALKEACDKDKINTLEIGQLCKYADQNDNSHYSVYLGNFTFLVLLPLTERAKDMTSSDMASFQPQLLSEMRGNYTTKYAHLEHVCALNYTLKSSKILEEYRDSASKAYIKPSTNEMTLVDAAICKLTDEWEKILKLLDEYNLTLCHLENLIIAEQKGLVTVTKFAIGTEVYLFLPGLKKIFKYQIKGISDDISLGIRYHFFCDMGVHPETGHSIGGFRESQVGRLIFLTDKDALEKYAKVFGEKYPDEILDGYTVRALADSHLN